MQQIEFQTPANFYVKQLQRFTLHKVTYNVLIALGLLHPNCAKKIIIIIFPSLKVVAWEMTLVIGGTHCQLQMTLRKRSMSSRGKTWWSGLFGETGSALIEAWISAWLSEATSSDSPPLLLFGSLQGNPDSPSSQSRSEARPKYRNRLFSLFFPYMPASFLPP